MFLVKYRQGRAEIVYFPASQDDTAEDCPICARHRDPVTGNPRYNAETVAAIEEGMAIMRGEIPAKRFSSAEEMWADLDKDDDD